MQVYRNHSEIIFFVFLDVPNVASSSGQMIHLTQPSFWQKYERLPSKVQKLADKNYVLLKRDPFHPSLHFKKLVRKNQLWSVRVGDHHHALGFDVQEGIRGFGLARMLNTISV